MVRSKSSMMLNGAYNSFSWLGRSIELIKSVRLVGGVGGILLNYLLILVD